jgi:transposase
VFTERTSVGLDVHARSVVAAAIDGETGEVFRARLTPGNDDVIGWVRSLPGPSAVVYEAGPTGFGWDQVRGRGPLEDPTSAWRPG